MKMTKQNKNVKHREVRDLKDNIIHYFVRKKVTSIGHSGHVVLPRDLIGKEVAIMFSTEEKEVTKWNLHLMVDIT